MIVGPLVFFSIATSIAEFGDIMALGRMFGRIILGYFCTSLVAITIGILVWHVFPIGNPALKEAVDVSAAASVTEQSAAVSLRDTLVGIVPKDIVSPFLNANMLQIIFIAAVVGIAAGMISGKLQVFQAFLADGYLLFSRVTTMIIGVMPLAVFCSMSKMVLGMNMKTLLSVFSWIPVCYIGCILMIAFYGLMILVFARLNPLKFFGKYYPVMLTAYTFASSNASLPSSMECCGNALGISRRLYAFSLPLGATINMDGSCVVLSVSALFMTKIFGVPVTGSLLTTLVLSIFVLSIGAPGVPGAALVCLSILLPQIGVPSEAISLIMGLYSLAGMILVCTNVTGDAVMTLIVGKQENQVDLQVYNS
jgi:Na+/H+-dicarboxylate symporter